MFCGVKMKTLGLFDRPLIKVYNKKDPNAQGVWVDRETPYGNPYHLGEDGNRKEVIAKFEEKLIQSREMAAMLPNLRNKSLICHCKPKSCHGDVWFKYANGFWLCVTGGRDFFDKKYIFDKLDKVNKKRNITLLIEGGEKGVDTICKKWAIKNKIPVAEEKAEWDRLGIKAEMIRNKRMLKRYKPDLLLAFEGGKGTANCVEEARKLGASILYAQDA